MVNIVHSFGVLLFSINKLAFILFSSQIIDPIFQLGIMAHKKVHIEKKHNLQTYIYTVPYTHPHSLASDTI